jgi:uncharacterized membrane protein
MSVMTTLIAVGFPHETTACAAAEDVQRLVSGPALEADAVAVLSRDEAGWFHVTTNHHAVAGDSMWGIFWILLFSVLFFVPSLGMATGSGLGLLLRKIEEADIDEAFQDGIRDLLQPGTSALFLAVGPPDSIGAISGLSRFGGRVIMTRLSGEAESELQHALHGRRPRVAPS